MKDVSIVIVNYNVKYFLEQTILSAQEALTDFDGEIIVIDNNSTDDSIVFLKERFPEVIFIENKDNVGFSRANNQGFEVAQGKYTLILNPDTVIGHNTIKDCVKWAESHEDCGGIGAKMHDGNGKFLPESKRGFPSPWNSFCKIFGLSLLFPNSPTFAKYRLNYLSNTEPHNIDILSGAFIFVKSSILKECGGFDNRFFMYGEDIDLSYRFTQLGYKNYYIPSPMIHYKGECTKKDSIRYVKIFYEAMLIFFRKHYPNYSKVYYFFIKFAIGLRASLAVMKRFFKAIFRIKSNNFNSQKTVIISNDKEAIKKHLDEMSLIVSIKSLKEFDRTDTVNKEVIIDNRIASYQEIIEFIVKNESPKNRFKIYSSKSDVIMNPKNA